MMYGGWGGGLIWMMVMPVFWIVLIGVIVWAAVALARRPVNRAAEQPGRETPQEVLDRRFASGEVDEDAYNRARALLAGKGTR